MRVRKHVVEFRGPPRSRRSVAALVLVVGAVAGGAAYASLPIVFADGNTVSAAQLNTNFSTLQAAIAALQPGLPACPTGYSEGAVPAPPTFTNEQVIVCTNSVSGDQLVRVGTGASAFWVDRYEASVWTAPSGGDPISDNSAAAYAVTVPPNGQLASPAAPAATLYALSLPNELPSRSVTWFQALEFCTASGKRLPTGQEWLRAARGTVDPGSNDGSSNAQCNTHSSSLLGVRPSNSALASAQAVSCVSDWGAEDMIGNLWEWTNDWFAGLGHTNVNDLVGTWPDAGFGANGTWNVGSTAYGELDAPPARLPAAGLRGGNWTNQTAAGIFALAADSAPSFSTQFVGFRCVLSGDQ